MERACALADGAAAARLSQKRTKKPIGATASIKLKGYPEFRITVPAEDAS